jgi:hypothetical protein
MIELRERFRKKQVSRFYLLPIGLTPKPKYVVQYEINDDLKYGVC